MLRSAWRYLMNNRTRAPRRPAKSRTYRPTLEGLEDRVTPASASQVGSTLSIIADPGTSTAQTTVLLQVDSVNPSKLDVSENGKSLGQFTISSINQVNVQVAGNDIVDVNDNNGFPLASGTKVSLFGASGTSNKLEVVGSRAVTGNDTFIAGTSTSNGTLTEAGVNFSFTGVFQKVSDEVANASSLLVHTTAPSIDFTGTNGVTDTLSGLASGTGGGGTLTFEGKASLVLDAEASNETVTLNATAAAQGLKSIFVGQQGTNSTTQINATPASGGTSSFVGVTVQDFSEQDVTNVAAVSAPLTIDGGGSSNTINLGSNPANPSKSVTSGINAQVTIQSEALFNIYDGGNTTTQENVTLTPTSITGTGLFGPKGSVQYSSVPAGSLVPQIFTGQLHETYTVTAPNNTSFNAQGLFDNIIDNSTTGGISVTVDVTAFTDLDLALTSQDPANSSLFISAPSSTEYNPFVLSKPNGFVEVAPSGATHSTAISYTGFDTVSHS
jgi:hypothetical protein